MSKDCFGIGGAEPYSYATIMSVQTGQKFTSSYSIHMYWLQVKTDIKINSSTTVNEQDFITILLSVFF